MYDMYPDWGPAAHDPEHPFNPASATRQALQAAFDPRDADGQRPDDN